MKATLTFKTHALAEAFAVAWSRETLTGHTVSSVQEHCSDPETSWSSCKFAEGKLRTKTCGPWFDGYEEN